MGEGPAPGEDSAPAEVRAPADVPFPAEVLAAAEDPLPARPRRRRRRVVTAAAAVLALVCLGAAIVAAGRAHAEQTRPPTQAERAAAGALGVASRWSREPAGQIFPATLAYYSNLLDKETARRAGISPARGCPAGLDPAVAATARRYGCRTVLRASYVDQLGGVVYTIGVLAFPTPHQAAAFLARYQSDSNPVRGLHAAAFAGTAAAAFTDAVREAAFGQQYGPYAVLTVAGFTDGRPASAIGERQTVPFEPDSQLADDVGTPLSQPVTVTCGRPEWTC
jgi:hypothetical protein